MTFSNFLQNFRCKLQIRRNVVFDLNIVFGLALGMCFLTLPAMSNVSFVCLLFL
ncbi:hypothetical protein HanRHA438_Chr04g0196801 [Helianthus annuus]|nr:hypothetical protein HanRHA438_Chr04g0196801 [Helianthus annuus]